MRTPKTILLAALLTLTSVSALLATDPYDEEKWKNGYFQTSTYGGFLSGGDLYSLSVNQYNGGVNLHIPILSLQGRAGHNLSITASYNSKQFWFEKYQ